jgi:hypothetical protein
VFQFSGSPVRLVPRTHLRLLHTYGVDLAGAQDEIRHTVSDGVRKTATSCD